MKRACWLAASLTVACSSTPTPRPAEGEASARPTDSSKPSPLVGTEEDRFDDCAELASLEMRQEARYVMATFDDDWRSAKPMLESKAADYASLRLKHPAIRDIGNAYAAAYRDAARDLERLWSAMGKPNTDIVDAQRRFLDAINAVSVSTRAVEACRDTVRPKGDDTRATCAILARASYASLRFGVFANESRANEELTEVGVEARRLGAPGANFVERHRERYRELLDLAARWRAAGQGPAVEALREERKEELGAFLDETDKDLERLCHR